MLPTPIFKEVRDKVYDPSEDSFLLLDCLEEEQQWLADRVGVAALVCEIGTGTGIITTFVKKHILPTALCLATDLNPHACRAVLETACANLDEKHPVDSLQMSLTTGIRANMVDVLIFNPPYVPAEEVPEVPTNDDDDTWLDLALLGGSDGMKVTQLVLDQLSSILSSRGVAYILFCARNNPDEVAAEMRKCGWLVESVIHRKAGWEVLSVLRFTR